MAKRQPNPYFRFQKFTVFHDQCAMKVGTDGVLLGAWVDVNNASSALDIGTGTGLISLIIAQRSESLDIEAIDVDTNAITQAKSNIIQSPFAEQIVVEQSSIQEYSTDKKFDIIVSNPPFFINSLKSVDEQRNLARHTDTLTAEDLIEFSSKLLSNKGKISLIYPFEYKESIIKLASEYKLYISRLTNVYPTPTSQPKRILVELSKDKCELQENILVIEEDRHIYSATFQELVKDLYIKV